MKNEEVAYNCVFCGAEAKTVRFESNMYYTVCSNTECKKHDKYAYLGSTKSFSIEAWNYMNRPINRVSTKKRKKDEDNSL